MLPLVTTVQWRRNGGGVAGGGGPAGARVGATAGGSEAERGPSGDRRLVSAGSLAMDY